MSNSPFPEISDEALQVGFRKATEFRNLLILASVVLAIVSLLFGLDFLLGSLLGSAIVGLNFHWTVFAFYFHGQWHRRWLPMCISSAQALAAGRRRDSLDS
jgi:hypothetical protein